MLQSLDGSFELSFRQRLAKNGEFGISNYIHKQSETKMRIGEITCINAHGKDNDLEIA